MFKKKKNQQGIILHYPNLWTEAKKKSTVQQWLAVSPISGEPLQKRIFLSHR